MTHSFKTVDVCVKDFPSPACAVATVSHSVSRYGNHFIYSMVVGKCHSMCMMVLDRHYFSIIFFGQFMCQSGSEEMRVHVTCNHVKFIDFCNPFHVFNCFTQKHQGFRLVGVSYVLWWINLVSTGNGEGHIKLRTQCKHIQVVNIIVDCVRFRSISSWASDEWQLIVSESDYWIVTSIQYSAIVN